MAAPTASKSHKSRKTLPKAAPRSRKPPVVGGSPSSTALAIVPVSGPPLPLASPLTAVGEEADQPTHQPQELEPKKQNWYRPPDSKARKLVDKIVVHRAAGREDREIAKLLKTTEGAVRQYVYIGKKNGWLDEEGEPIDLEAELAVNIDRKIVRNISASLDGQMTNWQTHEMTVAAAKGRGMFKNHEKSEGGVGLQQLPVVAIQIVMPPVGAVDQMVAISDDQVGGTPAYLEGVVEE